MKSARLCSCSVMWRGQARPAPPPYVHAAGSRCVRVAAKGSQKNQGMYFEYERVDSQADEQLRREAEVKQNEFDWVQQARKSARSHRERRESEFTGRRGKRGQGAGRNAKRPPKQQQRQQQRQQEQSGQAREAVALPPSTPTSETSTAAADAQDAPVQQPMAGPASARPQASNPCADGQGSSSSSSSSSGSAAPMSMEGKSASRKQRLLERMKGSAAADNVPATAASTAVVSGTPTPGAPVTPDDHKLVMDLQRMPDLPDLGPLDEDELQVRDLLSSHFVDGAHMDTAVEESNSLGSAVRDEVAAQQEFERWVMEVQNGSAPQQLDDAEVQRIGALLEQLDSDAAANGNGASSAATSNGTNGMPEVAAYLRSATSELAEFQSLAAQLAEEDAALSLSEVTGENDAEVEPDDQVLAQLRTSDPKLYDILSTTPSSREDDDLLSFLSASAASGSNPEDVVSDAEVQQILASGSLLRNDDAEFLSGGDDEEEEEEEGDLSDLFEAIDEDDDLGEMEKLKATYELQGIFNNAAADEDEAADSNDVKKKKSKGAPHDAAALRGVTTTGAARAGDAPPPPLMSKPSRGASS